MSNNDKSDRMKEESDSINKELMQAIFSIERTTTESFDHVTRFKKIFEQAMMEFGEEEDDFVVNSVDHLDRVEFQELENRILFKANDIELTNSSPDTRPKKEQANERGEKVQEKKEKEKEKESTESEEKVKDGVESEIEGGRVLVRTFDDGSHYAGEIVEGLPHGIGVMFLPDGHKYEGNWEEGLRHGRGCLTYPEDSRYDGQWYHGHRVGAGNYFLSLEGHLQLVPISDFSREEMTTTLCELIVDLHLAKKEAESQADKLRMEATLYNETNEMLQMQIGEEKERRKENEKTILDRFMSDCKNEELNATEEIIQLQGIQEEQTKKIKELEKMIQESKQKSKKEMEERVKKVEEEWRSKMMRNDKKWESLQKQIGEEQMMRKKSKEETKEMKNMLEAEKKENTETSRQLSKALIEMESLYHKLRDMEVQLNEREEQVKREKKKNGEMRAEMEQREEMYRYRLDVSEREEEMEEGEMEEMEREWERRLERIRRRRMERMKRRIEAAEDALRCKYCMSRRANLLLHPCGHLSMCEHCNKSVQRCPLCTHKIQKVTVVKMSEIE
ncbi:trichohyalin [Planoprotostelium fungivorum]|uniref:Trichohyalin n=1 Tax=Planoprotostelium fungivorum TaxID=1890364 RepID=A0A2P6NWN0_9EUKA|nr:trichohyalin [Planoprotostelium fungivorum]